MPPPPLRIFISSTAEDLATHRAAVVEAINRLDLKPVHMEMFGSRPSGSVAECRRLAAEADAVVVIVAHRYGWVPTVEDAGDGKRSITWLEVEAAITARVPVFAYLVDAGAPWTATKEQDRILDAKSAEEAESIRQAIMRLKEFKAEMSRQPRDTFSTPDDLAKRVATALGRWLSERTGKPPEQLVLESKIAVYREFLRTAHRELVPFFSDLTDRALGEIYVEVELDFESENARRLEGKRVFPEMSANPTLRRILELPFSAETGVTGRWVLLGEPGAGKSTVCRHLCLKLGHEPDGPVPVFASLARMALKRRHPFELAEEDVRAGCGETAAVGLAQKLRDLAGEGDRIYLLLDGLDEVPKESMVEIREQISQLASRLPSACIAVTSRRAGYEALGGSFRHAALQPLSETARSELLANWIPGRAAEVWSRLEATPTLFKLAENPLLLTLIAKIAIENKRLPVTEIGLVDAAIDVLLRRWHSTQPKSVRAPVAAKAILAAVSLALHAGERESWTLDELVSVVAGTRDDKGVNRQLRNWDTDEEFVDDVGTNGGVLGPHDGKSERWRYLHRSLREYLAAKRLAESGGKALLRRAKSMANYPDQVAHWGNTLAFACALPKSVDERITVYERLRDANPELALRALPRIEGLSIVHAYRLLTNTRGWDGDHLLGLCEACLARGESRADVARLLMRFVDSKLGIEELAYHYYTIERLELPVERDRFFRACDRPIERRTPEIACVPIPSDAKSQLEFEMGAPESETGSHDHERLKRRVSLATFRFGITSVTEEQYAWFDSARLIANKGLPVVNVSWWEAWLYCKWVGGSLPTEAQWEGACRAGTTTRYWSGDSNDDLKRVGWFKDNSSNRLQPVGKKPANSFGICDMHGNVREWCADWYGTYSQTDRMDPVGPPRGSLRVLRGGSYDLNADSCRAARRFGLAPGRRYHNVGFRVAWPAIPNS